MKQNDVLLAAAVCAIFAAGVEAYVWTIAYPAFAMIDPQRFAEFHALHSSRITVFIGPALIGAFAANLAYASLLPPGAARWLAIVAALASAAVLAITAFLQVPLHARLETRDLETIRRLNANEVLRAGATFVAAACDAIMLWLALAREAGRG